MKTLLAFLAIALCCPIMQAQNVEHQIVASQFGAYQVPTVGNGFAFPPDTCQVSGGEKNFPAFVQGVPVKIVDSNPAHIEVQTPVAVILNNNNCSVSMTTTYSHASFYLTSGTGGLQEALNAGQVTGGANTVILDQQWYAQVAPSNPATVIASVHGNTALGLMDVTTTPYTPYTWNGSQYIQVATGGGANTPATSNLLKGGGSINTVQAATPGTDYVVPSAIAGLAPINSPTFTGAPQAPTQAISTNNTNIATTQAVTSALVPYAPLASPALTGIPTVPTASPGTNTTQAASTAYVLANGGAQSPATSNLLKGNGSANGVAAATPGTDYVIPSALASYAPLASPAFSGVPTVPTASTGTNTTQSASTAFVLANAVGVAGAISGTTSVPQLVSQYVPTFTSNQISGAADSYATIQAAINAAIASNQELYMPCGTFYVSAGLVASSTNFRMRGCGNGTNGPPIQNTQIIASGYGYSTLVVGTGTPWALPQGWVRDIILSGPGITNTGYASLQLNGAVEYLVMDVTGGGDDMAFDFIGNCFGAMMINPVSNSSNTNIGINFRNGGQSGSDISVYNPWIHGVTAGIESAGSGGGYHIYGGQVAAEATSPTDTSGSVIVGKEYPSGTLGESSIDFFGTSFEPSNDVWVIRGFAAGRIACYDCSMNATNGGTPAIGVYKNTNQQEGQLTLDSTALSGYYSNAQLLVVSGSTVGGAWLSERGTYSAGAIPYIDGSYQYVSSMAYQSGITTGATGTDRAGLNGGGIWYGNNSGSPAYSTNQGSTWSNFPTDPGVNIGDLYYHGSSGFTRLAANGTAAAEVLVSTGTGGIPTPTTYTCGAYTNGAGNSTSCTWSASPPIGNYVMCGVTNAEAGSNTLAVNDSASDVYTGLGSQHELWNSGYTQTFFFGPLTSAITTTTVTSSAGNYLALKCQSTTYAGAGLDGQCTGDVTSGTSIPCGTALTTSQNNEYVFCSSTAASGTLTAGSGFTLGSTDYGADSANQYKVQSTAGSLTPSITNSASTDGSITCSAFKSAGTAAPTLSSQPALSSDGMFAGGTKFSVSGCGTATSLKGGSLAGQFTGGSATCTPVITTGVTAPNGYSCSMQDQTTSTAAFRQTANTATTATFTAGGTVGATDVITFHCDAF